MNKVFENLHLEMYDAFHGFPHTVLAYWKGYMSMEKKAVIEACEFSLEYFLRHSTKVMVSENSFLEMATVPFLEWKHAYYFPTAVRYGLKAEILLPSRIILWAW